MVIHYLTIFLQEAGVWSSSLDSRFRYILKKIDDLVIRDEAKARIDFENKECFPGAPNGSAPQKICSSGNFLLAGRCGSNDMPLDGKCCRLWLFEGI